MTDPRTLTDADQLRTALVTRAVEDRLLTPIVLYKAARAAGIEARASLTSAELARELTSA
jgi:hypothetical protein